VLEAVVVGAGQAGLAMSRTLRLAGIEHLVLERGRVGETWRSQRWDSFALNTPGSFSVLPGDQTGATGPDGFAARDEFVAYVESYPVRHGLPVRTGVTVILVEPRRGGRFVVTMDGSEQIETRAVVVATGIQRLPRIPPFAAGLPASVAQLHSTAYRNPGQVPAGAVLIVGSGQSGVQVAEDLLDAGRTVWLATSRTARFRRRYRGRDSFEWLREAGYFAQTAATLPDRSLQFAPQPVISGIGRYGHTVSLQWLSGRGVRLLGHVTGAANGRLALNDDLGANIAWGDRTSGEFCALMDRAIGAQGGDAPAAEADPADEPHPDPAAVHSPTVLDPEAEGIGAVIWTTGVRGEFGFAPTTAVSADSRPIQRDGVSPVPGLYFIGLPWLRNRASGILPGVGPDAEFLARHVAEHIARR
jgi:putative flavoprotein involved in K+ transport